MNKIEFETYDSKGNIIKKGLISKNVILNNNENEKIVRVKKNNRTKEVEIESNEETNEDNIIVNYRENNTIEIYRNSRNKRFIKVENLTSDEKKQILFETGSIILDIKNENNNTLKIDNKAIYRSVKALDIDEAFKQSHYDIDKYYELRKELEEFNSVNINYNGNYNTVIDESHIYVDENESVEVYKIENGIRYHLHNLDKNDRSYLEEDSFYEFKILDIHGNIKNFIKTITPSRVIKDEVLKRKKEYENRIERIEAISENDNYSRFKEIYSILNKKKTEEYNIIKIDYLETISNTINISYLTSNIINEYIEKNRDIYLDIYIIDDLVFEHRYKRIHIEDKEQLSLNMILNNINIYKDYYMMITDENESILSNIISTDKELNDQLNKYINEYIFNRIQRFAYPKEKQILKEVFNYVTKDMTEICYNFESELFTNIIKRTDINSYDFAKRILEAFRTVYKSNKYNLEDSIEQLDLSEYTNEAVQIFEISGMNEIINERCYIDSDEIIDLDKNNLHILYIFDLDRFKVEKIKLIGGE